MLKVTIVSIFSPKTNGENTMLLMNVKGQPRETIDKTSSAKREIIHDRGCIDSVTGNNHIMSTIVVCAGEHSISDFTGNETDH